RRISRRSCAASKTNRGRDRHVAAHLSPKLRSVENESGQGSARRGASLVETAQRRERIGAGIGACRRISRRNCAASKTNRGGDRRVAAHLSSKLRSVENESGQGSARRGASLVETAQRRERIGAGIGA